MSSIDRWITFDGFTEAELRQIYTDLKALPVIDCPHACLLNHKIEKADRYRECSERVVPKHAVTRRFLTRFYIPAEHHDGATPYMRECFHTLYFHRILTALMRHLESFETDTSNENHA